MKGTDNDVYCQLIFLEVNCRYAIEPVNIRRIPFCLFSADSDSCGGLKA